MSWFTSLLGRRFGKRVTTTAIRQTGRKNRLRMVLEQLERRDVPSTFLQVVSTPNYPTMGQFDAVSVTVNGTQYQYAGIQFGAKLAANPSALPGNGVPDFYAFCVDITAPANLKSPYQVATTPASTLPNGGAIAYLYDTFNSAVGSPLDKTHAAGLQLAIWEEEYGTNIVTSSDVSFMNSYNGTDATTSLLNQADTYLRMVPSNPTAVATVYKSASSDDQSLIGPPDTIVTTQQPAMAAAGTSIADQALVSGISPTGMVTFNLYNNPTASGTPLFTDTETLSGGVATSTGYVPSASGTVYWVDTYNGDANNLPITSSPTAEPVSIVNALISITPLTPVNPVGSPEVFTVTATAFPNGTGTPSFGPLNVTVNGGLTPSISGPSVSGNMATWTVTIDSNASGSFNVQASDTVTMGGVSVTRTTGDSFTGSDGSDSPSAVKNYVDALIAITPLTPVNPVGSAETFTITVTAFPAATGTPSFTLPAVSFPGGAPGTVGPVIPLSGPTQQPNGSFIETWTETIDSNKSGTFNVQASDTVTMGGVVITRTTGDGFTSPDGSDSPSAVKNYVDALIAISPLTPVNPLGSPETFTITVTAFPAATGTPTLALPTVSFPGGAPGTVGPVIPLSGPTQQPNGSFIETWTETINSNVVGTFNVQASDMVTMGGVVITRTTGDNFTSGDGSDSPSAVKHYISTLTIVTTQEPATASVGSPIADQATVSGGNNPTGTVTFNLYNNPTASGTPLFADTETLSGGVATSKSYVTTATGTDYWVDSYNGDANNVSVTSGVTAEPVNVVNALIAITPLTPVNPVGSPEVFTVTATAFPAGTGTPSFGPLNVTVSGGLTPSISGPTISGNMATWTVTIDSNTSGTFNVQASDTVTMGGVSVTRTTGDSFTSGDGSDSPSAVKNYVDALIAISPLTPVNPLNAPETFTITVTAFPAATGTPSFTLPTVSFPGGAPGTVGPVIPLSGPTQQPNGSYIETWTETINSSVVGFFNVQASDMVTMGGVVITRTTGDNFTSGDGSDSPSAIKQYIQTISITTTPSIITTNTPGLTTTPSITTPPAACDDNYYPNTTSDPLTGVVFNESDIFAGSTPADGTSISMQDGHLDVFYNDETAMTLGVSQITTKTSGGTTTQNFNVSPFSATDSGGAGVVMNPQVGAPYTPPSNPVTVSPSTLALQGGTDPSGRPMFPSLYVTDITGLDANGLAAHAGDWQYGGTPIDPSAVYGTWKTITETIDETKSGSPQISFNVGNNPSQNKWDLGLGADPVPASVVAASQGQQYSAELQWNLNSLNLIPGHSYRFYVIVHDGDQNKQGGDAGQGCVDLLFTGSSPSSSNTLNDSATLTNANNATGNIAFYLFAPGVTPNATLSNNVYTNVVCVNGNGTYTTAMGNNPGGYAATGAGVYQWVAVYSGDSNNASVTSPFGSEPDMVAVPPCPDDLYPYSSSDPLTGVVFNESDIFAGSTPADGTSISMQDGHLDVFYNDETAMTLGVSQITTKTSGGTTTQNFNVSPFSATDSGGAGVVMNPQVGAPYTPPSNPVTVSPSTLALQGGTDPSGRPMFPSLYVTDITNNLDNTSGDWQQGGTPIGPSAVYGTWKTITETIDETKSGNPQISFNVGNNPSQNKWDLGPGADPVPASVVAASQGEQYSAELQWNLSSLGLIPGHTYRFYMIIHDGDQNKQGGDSGQGCLNLVFSGNGPVTPTPNPGSTGGTIAKLNDSATLSGGTNPTGHITFYLFAPGITPNATYSNNVYSDQVTISGNGTYTTAMGNNPGGYVPTVAGTYQWVAVYGGDSNNSSVTSPFGSEPLTVSGTPGISIVKLTNGVNDPNPNGANVPQLAPGTPVTWTYLVTNTGNVPFSEADIVVTDNQPGVTPEPDLVSGGFIMGDTNDNNILDPGETWTYFATGTALNLTNPPAGVTTVPLGGTGTSVGVSLGSAANYAIVAVNGFNINGPGTITGNVASGNNTVLTNPAVINGTVYYSGSISGNSTPSGGKVSTNLSQVFADAKTAASTAFALPATQSFGNINNSTTVNGNGGTNVIDVSGINLSNGALTLNGSASDIFIVNDTGSLTSSNSNIAISGGVTPNHVLINVAGSVTITGGGPNNFYGTILAPNSQVTVHDKLLTGQLIGNTITDTSGFSVNFPPTTNVYQNTGTVTVTVTSTNTTLTASYVSNYRNPSAVPQLVTGTASTSSFSELLNPTSTLKPGKITVAVNLPKGPQAAAEAAAIKHVLANYNAELKPLGISFVEVTGAAAATAKVHINMATTTDIGGMAQGVLGDYSLAQTGNITLVEGWNWYFGANPAKIGANQYDFESVVSHELGHVLGLGENNDPHSAMDLFLGSGEVSRNLSATDLAAIETELTRKSVPVTASSVTTGSTK